MFTKRALLLCSVFAWLSTLPLTAHAQLRRVWTNARPPGSMLAIGHITSTTALQALFGAYVPRSCGGQGGFDELIVQDLSTGQVVATWDPECPGNAAIGPFTDANGAGEVPGNKWIADVDGDGLSEILCVLVHSDPTYAGFTCLKFDFATGTLTPDAPPAESMTAIGTRAVPNPAVRFATISFNLPASETASVRVFDIAGRSVRRVDVHSTKSGEQSVVWDAKDESGRQVPSGTYLYTVTTRAGETTKQIVVLH